MPFNNTVAVTPRQELPYAIMQGAGLNDTLIWPILAPAMGLNQRTAHLPQFTIAGAELMRIIERITAPGADAPRMTATISDFLFTLGIRRIEIGIPDENEMDWARLFDLITFYGRMLGKDMLALSLEYLVAQQLFSTANFGAAVSAGYAYTNANQANNSFISDILSLIESVRDAGEAADTIVLSSRVLERVSQAPNVIQYILGSLAGVGAKITGNAIQGAFAAEGIDTVLIGRAQVNTAPKGQKLLTRIWSDNFIWVGKRGKVDAVDNMGIPIISGAMCTPFWEPMGLMTGDNYRDEPHMQEVVRGKLTGNPTVFNPNAGKLLATGYA